MSKGDRKNVKYKQKWYIYIYYSEKVQWDDHVIHPIPEYKISTQVIMFTNILSK